MSSTINTQITKLSSKSSGDLEIYEVSGLKNLELEHAESSDEKFIANEILAKLCQAKENSKMTKNIPEYLRDLLSALEVAQHDSILSLWETAAGYCESAQDTLEKVLPWCKSEECAYANAQVRKKLHLVDNGSLRLKVFIRDNSKSCKKLKDS